MTKKHFITFAAAFCLFAGSRAFANDTNPDTGPKASPAPPCSMDMDPNGGIDFGDFLWVIANWGPCTDALGGQAGNDDRCRGDVNADGQIGFAEILFVLNHFGQNCVQGL